MSERNDAHRLDAAITELVRGTPLNQVLAHVDPELVPYLQVFGQLQRSQPAIEGPSDEFRMRLRARFVQGANREVRMDQGRGSRLQRAAVASAASLILGSALNPALAHELVTQVRETMGRAAADVLNAALFVDRRGDARSSLPHTPADDGAPVAPQAPEQPFDATGGETGASGITDLVWTTADTPADSGAGHVGGPDGGSARELPGGGDRPGDRDPRDNAPSETHDEPDGTAADASDETAAAPSPAAQPDGSSGSAPGRSGETSPGAKPPIHAQGNPPAESPTDADDAIDEAAPEPGDTLATVDPPASDGTPGDGGFNPGEGSAASDGPPGLDGELPPGHGGALPADSQGNGNGPPDHAAASDGPPGLAGAAGSGGVVNLPSILHPNGGPPEHAQPQNAHAGPPEHAQSNKESAGPPEHAQSNKQNAGPPEHAQSDKESAGLPEHAQSDKESAGPPEQAQSDKENAGPPEHAQSDKESAGKPGDAGEPGALGTTPEPKPQNEKAKMQAQSPAGPPSKGRVLDDDGEDDKLGAGPDPDPNMEANDGLADEPILEVMQSLCSDDEQAEVAVGEGVSNPTVVDDGTALDSLADDTDPDAEAREDGEPAACLPEQSGDEDPGEPADPAIEPNPTD